MTNTIEIKKASITDLNQAASINSSIAKLPPITNWEKARLCCPDCPASFNSKKQKQVLCPCCGEGYVDYEHVYDKCNVCGWIDDQDQYDFPYMLGIENRLSLFQARKAYRKGVRFSRWQLRKKQIRQAECLM